MAGSKRLTLAEYATRKKAQADSANSTPETTLPPFSSPCAANGVATIIILPKRVADSTLSSTATHNINTPSSSCSSTANAIVDTPSTSDGIHPASDASIAMNDPSETPSSLVFTNDAAAAFANGLESGRTASSTLPDRIMGGLLGFNGGEVVAASEITSLDDPGRAPDDDHYFFGGKKLVYNLSCGHPIDTCRCHPQALYQVISNTPLDANGIRQIGKYSKLVGPRFPTPEPFGTLYFLPKWGADHLRQRIQGKWKKPPKSEKPGEDIANNRQPILESTSPPYCPSPLYCHAPMPIDTVSQQQSAVNRDELHAKSNEILKKFGFTSSHDIRQNHGREILARASERFRSPPYRGPPPPRYRDRTDRTSAKRYQNLYESLNDDDLIDELQQRKLPDVNSRKEAINVLLRDDKNTWDSGIRHALEDAENRTACALQHNQPSKPAKRSLDTPSSTSENTKNVGDKDDEATSRQWAPIKWKPSTPTSSRPAASSVTPNPQAVPTPQSSAVSKATKITATKDYKAATETQKPANQRARGLSSREALQHPHAKESSKKSSTKPSYMQGTKASKARVAAVCSNRNQSRSAVNPTRGRTSTLDLAIPLPNSGVPKASQGRQSTTSKKMKEQEVLKEKQTIISSHSSTDSEKMDVSSEGEFSELSTVLGDLSDTEPKEIANDIKATRKRKRNRKIEDSTEYASTAPRKGKRLRIKEAPNERKRKRSNSDTSGDVIKLKKARKSEYNDGSGFVAEDPNFRPRRAKAPKGRSNLIK